MWLPFCGKVHAPLHRNPVSGRPKKILKTFQKPIDK
jgi:hypothetical protein